MFIISWETQEMTYGTRREDMTGRGWKYLWTNKDRSASRECQTHIVKSISKVTPSFQQVVHRTFQTKSSRAVCLVSNIRCVISNVKDDQSCDNCKINDRQRQNWSVRVSLNPRFATVRRGLNLLLPPTLGDMPMISLPLHLASPLSSSSSLYIINLLRQSKREVALYNCDAFVEVIHISIIVSQI